MYFNYDYSRWANVNYPRYLEGFFRISTMLTETDNESVQTDDQQISKLVNHDQISKLVYMAITEKIKSKLTNV